MGCYEQHVLPWLIHFAMGSRELSAYRARIVSGATGNVLEIGIGSGRNLPFYDGRVERVVGLDPSPRLLSIARKAAGHARVPVDLIRGSAEAIPLPDRSVDTVVMTWTLCSIPDACQALSEMRRVLRPDGRLLFVEHGLAPDERVRQWQHRLDPLWTRISCHLDRPMDRLIRDAGFDIERLDEGYLRRGPKPITFMYEGTAEPRHRSARA